MSSPSSRAFETLQALALRSALPLTLLAADPTASADRLAPAADRIALEGGLVHTMVPGEEPRIATVLIEDGKVVEIGTDLELAPGTERHDVSGKHLVPGLIDGYVNFDPDHDAFYTAAGVVLVRDVGGPHSRLLAEKAEERRARSMGPALITAGALIEGDPPSTPTSVVVTDPEGVAGLIEALDEADADFLSVFPTLAPEAWKKVIDVGHEHDLDTWGLYPSSVSLEDALAAGHDGLHFLDALLPPGVTWDIVLMPAFNRPIELLVEHETGLVPLLYANEARLHNQGTREFAQLLQLLHPSYEMQWKAELASRIPVMSKEILETGERIVAKQADLLGRMHAAGVRVLPGSGAPQPWLFPGQALHQELANWAAAGVAAADVMRSATRGAAEILGVEERYGSIQPGAVASLLVLERDPREDVSALFQPERVVLRGRVIEQADIEDMLSTVAKHQGEIRQALSDPVEVAPPPTIEGAVVILEGTVESRVFGLRVSTERFHVMRIPEEEGRLVFVGRVVYPNEPGLPERELLVSQTTKDGELMEIQVAMREDQNVVEHKGLWVANRWQMQGKVGDEKLPIASVLVRPACADVGTITTLLLLGQTALSERIPVVVFHEFLQPEVLDWTMEMDGEGNHQLLTHLGRQAFRFNEVGAPDRALSVVGARGIETALLASDAFGGPGLALPADKRALIAERKKAAAEAAAQAATEAGGAGMEAGAKPGGEVQGDTPPTDDADGAAADGTADGSTADDGG